MINVRAGQMDRLNEQASARFVSAEADRLAGYAPPLAALGSTASLQRAVRLGLKAAQAAGFAETPQIQLYLDLMTSFGSHFDTDPQYQWLHPLLKPSANATSFERSRLLHWHSTLYLERAYGKTGVHGIAFGMHASRLDGATLAEVGADYIAQAPHLLAGLHPQRVPYLSGSTGRALIEKAAADAPLLGLGGAAAAPLLLCLMFAFGHRVADDPLHPWVGDVLSRATGSGADKTAALLARAQATVATLLKPVLEARR